MIKYYTLYKLANDDLTNIKDFKSLDDIVIYFKNIIPKKTLKNCTYKQDTYINNDTLKQTLNYNNSKYIIIVEYDTRLY